jgi:hypothetical protein
MDLTDPQTVQGWYDLFWKVSRDLRGMWSKGKDARLGNYRVLFKATREIHINYLEIFVNFRNDFIAAKNAKSIAAAKDRFLQGRQKYSLERMLLISDADALVNLFEDEKERKFLKSVISYVSARRELNPSEARTSISVSFWEAIERDGDRDSILRFTNQTIEELSGRYASLIADYARIDPYFKLDAK